MVSTAYNRGTRKTVHGLCRVLGGKKGQATVEFALVMFAFLALLAGLGALCDFGRSGALAKHASESASHAVGGSDAGAWADVLAY